MRTHLPRIDVSPRPAASGRRARIPRAARVLAAGALAAALLVPATAVPAAATERLVVQFETSADASDRGQARREAATVALRALATPGAQAVLAADPADALRRLRRSPHVRYAEIDQQVTASVAAPDDPDFPQLWGLSNTGQTINGRIGTAGQDIRALAAWDQTRGAGVTVAVLDSGADLGIPDLAVNAWTNPSEIPGNGVDEDGNGKIDDVNGWSFVSRTGDVADDDGHGTHVAGTIAAAAGNGIGIAGVAPQARLLPVKVLDADGSGYTSDVADGFAYAAQQGAAIVNASLGGTSYSRYLHDAIARYPGVLLVSAAGNSAQNVDAVPEYPCSYELANVVCVAASTNTGALASFSNYGASGVDLAAPGRDIRSYRPGGALVSMSGTSMATPHVAGAAALMKAHVPSATPTTLRATLMSASRPSPMLTSLVGSGGLDAAAAIDAAAAFTAAVPTLAPTVRSAPTLTGTPLTGQTLLATEGTFDGAESLAWSWEGCDASGTTCEVIAGASTASLPLTSVLLGQRVRAVLTASNAAGSTRAASEPTPAITEPLPLAPLGTPAGVPTGDSAPAPVTSSPAPAVVSAPTPVAASPPAVTTVAAPTATTVRITTVRRVAGRRAGTHLVRVTGTAARAGTLTVRSCDRVCTTARTKVRAGRWTAVLTVRGTQRPKTRLRVQATLRPWARTAATATTRRTILVAR